MSGSRLSPLTPKVLRCEYSNRQAVNLKKGVMLERCFITAIVVSTDPKQEPLVRLGWIFSFFAVVAAEAALEQERELNAMLRGKYNAF